MHQPYHEQHSTYSNQAKLFYNNHEYYPNKYQTHSYIGRSSRSQFIAEEDEENLRDEEKPYDYNQYSGGNSRANEELAAAGIDETDIDDIFSFARHGRIEEIERLLTKGIPVDVRDTYGNTILITACQNGNKRVAKAVLRRGADINARNFKGNTPLHYCYHCKENFIHVM